MRMRTLDPLQPGGPPLFEAQLSEFNGHPAASAHEKSWAAPVSRSRA